MFKQLTQWMQRPKMDQARDTGPDFEKLEEEMMHNMCELSDKGEIFWSASLNH